MVESDFRFDHRVTSHRVSNGEPPDEGLHHWRGREDL